MTHIPKTLPVALAALSIAAAASIESLDLRKMVARADDAVAGTIIANRTTLVTDPMNGPQVFTWLTVKGTSLYSGQPATKEVGFLGGSYGDFDYFVSTMPSSSETQPGNRVVVFSRRETAFGGPGNHAIYAALGGIFRMQAGRGGEVALGKGKGFAIEKTTYLADLMKTVPSLRAEIERQKREGK